MSDREITLKIEGTRGAKINKGMFGVFYEDINYCCDGGISAEQLENAAFEFVEALGYKDNYSTKYDGLYGWIAYPTNADGAKLDIERVNPVSKNAPHYLVFEPGVEQNAFANKAYDGVYLREGMSYHVSAYLRSDSYTGGVRVKIGSQECALTEKVTSEWKKYEVSFTASKMQRHELFVVELEAEKIKAGDTICADFFSLVADDAVCGVFRRDIVELLKSMKPGFMRFPGGCIVEGNKLSNSYRWKNTVGSREERIRNWNRWAVHGNEEKPFAAGKFSHYNQSYDIGYYEYFLLCEYIGAKPLPVQNVGMACQYQSTQMVSPDSNDFMEYVQDVLDLIEFANGDVNTRWGSLRTEMGHPASFNLEMIGIGNEQWETENSRFFERYSRFEKAVHEKYPEIKLIGSAGPDVKSDYYKAAWAFYRSHGADNAHGGSGENNFVYAVDEHYYCPPRWFIDNDDFYDNYPRNVKVFAGEYAAHIEGETEDGSRNTLGAALAEAAFLTGVERNADVVALASYAPLFARVGYEQWSPDLIWFDDATCFGTPSFYVQAMYSHDMGGYVVKSRFDGEREKIYQTVSYDEETHELIIKLVNYGMDNYVVNVDTDGYTPDYRKVQCYIMGEDDGEAHNDIEHQRRIRVYDLKVEHSGEPEGRFSVRAHSFGVFRVKAERNTY